MKTEPAIIAAAIVALLQVAILLEWIPALDLESVEVALVTVLTVIGGVFVRQKVTPNAKIEKVGLDPARIAADAKRTP